MTGKELDKVFLLLRQFYPQHPYWEDENRQLAYRMALEPYTYNDVKASILGLVRRQKAFPFVSEITEGLVIPEEAVPEPPKQDDNMFSKFDREVKERYGSWAAYRQLIRSWIEELEAK